MDLLLKTMSSKHSILIALFAVLLLLAACRPANDDNGEAEEEVTLPPVVEAAPSVTQLPTAVPATVTPTPFPVTPTSEPEATKTAAPRDLSITANDVQLYPVPFIISGDRVTFQVRPNVPHQVTVSDIDVDIFVNEQIVSSAKLDSRNWAGQAEGIYEWVWDTTGQFGNHTVRIVLDGGDLIQDGDTNPDNNETVFDVDIGKIGERPLEERDVSWITTETDCCKVSTLTRTAAYRDLPELLDAVEYAVSEAAVKLQEEPKQKIEVFFIDRTIGQGGYAGSEMAVTYIDRPYAGGNLHELLVHEAVHVLDRQFAPQRTKFLAEGIAVWASGGHYKPEDLNQRAAALLATGQYIPLTILVNDFYPAQHEIGYLQAGAFVTYLVDQFGYATFRDFYADTSTSDTQSDLESLDLNLQTYYGSSLIEMETEWHAYLQTLTVDEVEIADLETTIRYYEIMRHYQELYDPTAHFLGAWLPSLLAVKEGGNPADLTRHPHEKINVTLEVMLQNAEAALMEKNLVLANVLLDSIERILTEESGFTDPLSSSYEDIVEIATNFGYEVQDIDLQGDVATVLATTASGIHLMQLDFERRGGDWAMLN